MEVWLPIPATGGIYEASSLGRIRSKDRLVSQGTRWGGITTYHKPGRVLRPWKDGNGYAVVYICIDGGRVATNSHRLIAQAFHGDSGDHLHVNHIDGDKANNCAENLEWSTRAENMAHARIAGLVTDNKPVIGTPKQGGASIAFESMAAAARFVGKGHRNIQSAAHGLIPSAYGFVWKFAT